MTRHRARSNGEGSLYPHRNGYAAYVWVTTPSGRRQRKYVYGKTRPAVHAKWLELSQEAARGPILTKVPTIEQYLNRWLEETVAPNLAPLTHATYESHVRNYIISGIGSFRIDRLRVSDVQKWLNRLPGECQCCAQGKDARRAQRSEDLARCCAINKCCESYPSPRTIKDLRTVLRSALSSAMSEELVEKNVAALVKSPKQRRRKLVPWSSEEARRFLESARADNDPLYAAYVLVLVLGMRKGEVLGLTWDAADFDAAELVIDHQSQRVRRALLHRETKTEASDALLPMPRTAATALALRKQDQQADREEVEGARRGLDQGPHFVFTGPFGTPIDPRTSVGVVLAHESVAIDVGVGEPLPRRASTTLTGGNPLH